jgi:hypothetical protein
LWTWPEIVDKCAKEKSFKVSFNAAKDVKLGKVAAPVFNPASLVAGHTLQGHMCFYDVGVLSETDVARECKVPCNALKLKMNSTIIEDGVELKATLISLKDLTPSELASCRKIRMFHTVQVFHEEQILMPTRQIRQEQGQDMYDFVSQHEMQNRQEQMKPINRFRLPTLPNLRAKAQELIQAREQVEQIDADVADSEASDGDDEPRQAKQAAPSLGIGSVATRGAPKVKVRNKPQGATASGKKGQSAKGKSRSRSRSPGSSKATGTSNGGMVATQNRDFSGDSEMGMVASKMMKISPSPVPTCLAQLSVVRFLDGEKLGRTLTAAGV